jgi:hypothetical protein
LEEGFIHEDQKLIFFESAKIPIIAEEAIRLGDWVIGRLDDWMIWRFADRTIERFADRILEF